MLFVMSALIELKQWTGRRREDRAPIDQEAAEAPKDSALANFFAENFFQSFLAIFESFPGRCSSRSRSSN
jgi:hypothetical protein